MDDLPNRASLVDRSQPLTEIQGGIVGHPGIMNVINPTENLCQSHAGALHWATSLSKQNHSSYP